MTARRTATAGSIACAVLLATVAVEPALAATDTVALDNDESSGDAIILLDVVINRAPTHRLVEFSMRSGVLRAKSQDLRDLGFVMPDGVAAPDGELVVAAALAGATLQIDRPSQTLYITAPDAILQPALIDFGNRPDNGALAQSGTGAVFDYDVVVAEQAGRVSPSAHPGFRLFSPIGVLAADALVFVGRDRWADTEIIRLDTSYVYADETSLHTYTIGDFITGGLGWSRPVRFGGARIAADFRTRPDLVTFPVPVVTGSVAVPSTLDIMVNGSQLGARTVQPGPFEVGQMPLVTGAGTISLTTTDALGRQVTTNQSFYASWDLLAPGLQTWAIEAGAVRRRWGIASNDYGALGASATYRRGITPRLTVEGHAEAVGSLAMAGGGLALNVADLATVNIAGAASVFHGKADALVSVSAQRISQSFSFGLSATVADHGFRDFAAMNGDNYPYRQLTFNAGLPLGRFGSLSAFLAVADRDAGSVPVRFSSDPTLQPYFVPASQMRLATVSYTGHIGNLSFYINGFNDFANGGGRGVLAGVSLPFGSRSSLDVSTQWNGKTTFGQAQMSRNASAVGDWGYRVFAATGNPQHAFAEANYIAPWATVRIGADVAGGSAGFLAEVRGAVSVADGGVFASNNIDDSFAIVDTHGAPGIRVLVENRFAGVTDAAGRLLVPSLRSYELNNLSIDPVGAPMDAVIPVTSARVRPRDRSGVVVSFPVTASHAASLRLADATGTVLPVGSVITLVASGASTPVGFDGEAYLVGLTPGQNWMAVVLPDGKTCSTGFAYQPAANDVPDLGTLTCAAVRP